MTMFERYTDRARRTLVLAQDEARNLGHGHVSTGHLLLGLIGEDGGVAAQALKSLGVSLEDARRTVSREPCGPAAAPGAPLPFTPRLKIVLETALRESLKLGHSYIATEHLLLGLAAGSVPGASPLVAIGVSPDDARAKVLELLQSYEETGKRPLAPEPGTPLAVADQLTAALAALDAVLKLHQPHPRDGGTCVACAAPDDEDGMASWPCPTVQAITRALTGGGGGGG